MSRSPSSTRDPREMPPERYRPPMGTNIRDAIVSARRISHDLRYGGPVWFVFSGPRVTVRANSDVDEVHAKWGRAMARLARPKRRKVRSPVGPTRAVLLAEAKRLRILVSQLRGQNRRLNALLDARTAPRPGDIPAMSIGSEQHEHYLIHAAKRTLKGRKRS